jgi:hypothetical protein
MSLPFLLYVVAGSFIALLLYHAWTQFKWRLGFSPAPLDKSQANIAAKESAAAYAERIAAGVKEQTGEEMPEADKTACVADAYTFALGVIETYCRRLELPKLDLTPDPLPIAQPAEGGPVVEADVAAGGKT